MKPISNFEIALRMLGDTIDFYDDDGNAVLDAYYDGVEAEVLKAYNDAIESIRKRYDVMESMLEDFKKSQE